MRATPDGHGDLWHLGPGMLCALPAVLESEEFICLTYKSTESRSGWADLLGMNLEELGTAAGSLKSKRTST